MIEPSHPLVKMSPARTHQVSRRFQATLWASSRRHHLYLADRAVSRSSLVKAGTVTGCLVILATRCLCSRRSVAAGWAEGLSPLESASRDAVRG